jgi:uncharacterized membrane protein HdeD (DUF308 family)
MDVYIERGDDGCSRFAISSFYNNCAKHENASWLPLSSALVLAIGILRCVDALTSDRKALFFINMQGALIDIVCGFIILTSFHEEAATLGLLIAAYLLIQGMGRIIVTFSLTVPNPISTRIGGLISVLLGIMAWMNWPFSAMWFLSIALSIDITNRGWALIFYAYSVKKQKVANQQRFDN